MNENFRILVVDDDYNMSRTLADIFHLKGYAVDIALSGAEAVEMVAARHFDCVLSDIKMPHMNGVELYRAITAICPYLPVVLMTGYAANIMVRQALHEGVLGIVSKPLNIEKLLTFFTSLRQECFVAIIGDHRNVSQTLVEMLPERHFSIIQIDSPTSGADDLPMETSVVLLNLDRNYQKELNTLDTIRQHDPTLPVVLLIADDLNLPPVTKHAIERGASACIKEPFDPDRLSKLLVHLHHRHVGRALGQELYPYNLYLPDNEVNCESNTNSHR